MIFNFKFKIKKGQCSEDFLQLNLCTLIQYTASLLLICLIVLRCPINVHEETNISRLKTN